MLMSDWISVVCSSYLGVCRAGAREHGRVRADATEYGIGSHTAGQPVIAGPPSEDIVAGAAVDDVIALVTVDRIGEGVAGEGVRVERTGQVLDIDERSEEHTSELQSLMRISYAVFCLKQKKT